MSISNELMYAILSMDAYNRGYGEGIEGLYGQNTRIGKASFISESDVLLGSVGVTSGFYASVYSYKEETVISYRGTDSELELLATDFPLAGSNDFDEPQVHLVSQWLGDGKQYIYIANQNCSAEPKLRLAS